MLDKQSSYFEAQLLNIITATQQRRLQTVSESEVKKTVKESFASFLKEVDTSADKLDDKQNGDREKSITQANLIEATVTQVAQQYQIQKNAIDDIISDIRYLFTFEIDQTVIEEKSLAEEERIQAGEDAFWPIPK